MLIFDVEKHIVKEILSYAKSSNLSWCNFVEWILKMFIKTLKNVQSINLPTDVTEIYLYKLCETKNNEILSFMDKWMELENVILSVASQAQKTKGRLFSLICGIYT
jgi:hypothetical protein